MKKKIIFLVGLIIGLVAMSSDCFAYSSLSYEEVGVTNGDCYDVEFVFARGSGAEYMNSDMWYKYESEMNRLANRIGLRVRVTDVDYPAVSILSPITNAVGAYISAGKYYEFGKSVNVGVK